MEDNFRRGRDIVAPRAGAWIETLLVRPDAPDIASHPVRVRGLKPEQGVFIPSYARRTPCGCVD